jgi:hypothetical protein
METLTTDCPLRSLKHDQGELELTDSIVGATSEGTDVWKEM